MRLVIVTGMSGAGKTSALKMLEDLGFYCVDNLPIPLMEAFVELVMQNRRPMRRWRLELISGAERSFLSWSRFWKTGKHSRFLMKSCFSTAVTPRWSSVIRKPDVLIPLREKAGWDSGIQLEREKLAFIKQQANVILDTSSLLTRELRKELEKIFVQDRRYQNLFITVLSFGFKYGIPNDADLVFDVRFLPNPYYVEALRSHTGQEAEVQAYVRQGGTADKFLSMLYEMLDFLIPNYVQEGKNQLVIAIGCTGGKHRSVTVANALYQHLSGLEEYGLKIEHRDIER